MPPKPPRRAGSAAAKSQRIPLAMSVAFPRLDIGEADFVGLCDALKVSEGVREKAWKTYESLSAADGALVSTCLPVAHPSDVVSVLCPG
uniref:Uncharacterized protein n=1 Tax=Amazona collaria TaxID=241587 RepID=A0A8B9IUQ1_9PSIT